MTPTSKMFDTIATENSTNAERFWYATFQKTLLYVSLISWSFFLIFSIS